MTFYVVLRVSVIERFSGYTCLCLLKNKGRGRACNLNKAEAGVFLIVLKIEQPVKINIQQIILKRIVNL